MKKEGFKISILGTGNVGQMAAFLMCLFNPLVKIYCFGRPNGSINNPRARVMEVKQALKKLGKWTHDIHSKTDPEDLRGSDIVIISGGATSKVGQSRYDLLKGNAKIVKTWCEYIRVKAPGAVVIVVTNPSGPNTDIALKVLGFLPERVIGLSSIDSTRIEVEIADKLAVSGKEIKGQTIGDHSERMVIPIEQFTLYNQPIFKNLEDRGKQDLIPEIKELATTMKTASQPIIEGLKGASPWLLPGAGIFDLCLIILNGVPTATTVLWSSKGKNGIKGVVEVPIMLNHYGVIDELKVELTEEQKKEFKKAASGIKKAAKSVYEHLGI